MIYRPIRLRQTIAGLAFATTVCFPFNLSAQTLVRGSGVLGLPEIRIDLSTRAAERYAIVIGNGDYETAPDLANANADARLMASFLRDQGYEVIERHNLTKLGFEELLRRVLFDVSKQSEVIFYYAGHGLQIGAGNYIVPVDANLDTAYDVPFETVSLESLVAIIGARARVQLIILDSCRDNPFANLQSLSGAGNELSESRNGFSTLSAPVNSLLAFSTSPGQIALDGEGDNSPFTAALIETASANPDKTVTGILEEVRRLVYQRTNGQQVPWESSTLVEQISFRPTEAILLNTQVMESGGASRTLAVVGNVVDLPESETTAAPIDIALQATLSPEIEIGAALREALDLSETDTLSIVRQPVGGRLAFLEGDGSRIPADMTGAVSRGLDQILYSNAMPQTDGADVENIAFTDDFTVLVNGQEQVVRIALEGSPCDVEAGDHLDPEGSGLTRYANEIRPEIALRVCLEAVQKNPEIGRFHYQLGRAYRALRRFDEARAAFETARDLGHTRAWVAIGNAIADEAKRTGGVSNAQVPDEALAYYIIGVDQGDPYAMYALGRQLLRFETNQDLRQQGYDLMMRSLEVGHTFAMNELGYFYLDEDSDWFDAERGLRYLRESAARSDIYGFNNMGLVYRDGLGGTAKDAQVAYDWFVQAATGGHPNAPGNIGLMYERGELGRSGSAEKAMEWYEVGIERGDPWAGIGAAYTIQDQRPTGFERFEAATFAAKSAALSDLAAGNEARNLLGGLNRSLLDSAAQQFIVDFGENITVDGAFGAGSQAALDRVAVQFGVTAPTGRIDRLVFLAGLYWTTTPFRVDLY
ncbi:MAG: caspase family protein [Rhodobacteraceae bacterium]|nr:caspase family protein [Paracoccaceae bacterium]